MRLRPYQQAAVSSAVTALTHRPRASVVMACGTGKTVVGAAVTDRVAAGGRTVMFVPTLELLLQTLQELRRWHSGRPARPRMVAVCSDDEAARHSGTQDQTDTTTTPGVLAALLRSPGRAIVVCTYASARVIAAAHASHGLPGWDLMVVDEAHRTAGTAGRPWAQVHHDTAIPARRRLYMTATPRVYAGDGDRPWVSMDDQDIFGPVVYRLSFAEAIRGGLLADYQVLVPVVTDPQLHRLLSPSADSAGQEPDLRLLGVQVAVLRAAARHGLTRILTYHSRVAAARQVASQLGEVNALLPAQEQATGLWARWIAGTQSVAVRRAILSEYRRHDPAGVAVLANARVLGEGVDIPAVDAVAFADPKTSIIDSVQAVGRALRTGGRTDKVATIIVPVFVGPDADPENVLDGSAYRPLWMTLRALRAHDDRINAELNSTHLATLTDQPAARDLPSWLRIEGIDQPRDLALAIQLHTIGAKSLEWRRGYAAARRFHAKHGHLRAPQTYVDDRGVRLGSWLNWQRYLHRLRSLPAARVTALEELGMVWEVRLSQWEKGLRAAQRWHAEHGHLAVPIGTVVAGVNLGGWLRNLRHRPPAPERAAQLARLDPIWDAPWPLAWRRSYHDLRAYRAQHGNTDVPRTYQTPEGRHLGEWVYRQRERAHTLDDRQRRLLEELGFTWQVLSPHEQSWQERLSAARDFRATFGHLDIPQKHVTATGIALGYWVNNVRRRWDRLSEERRAELIKLGFRAPRPAAAPSAVFQSGQ
ncbi:Helicase associated domain protein [Actinomadura viridis]|uniref:DEAD/DEAH box helicase n=1 Tax=Actinomadura viridis TaxID=58110 RepID=UPI00367C1FB6